MHRYRLYHTKGGLTPDTPRGVPQENQASIAQKSHLHDLFPEKIREILSPCAIESLQNAIIETLS